ncbi:cysteine methyltransferase [Streptomyces sp. CC53]|uniref:methylated-DNA--[protein]-cysteine S-methyltransferase n=1 Tax=unclassified Streptomyces TaxID=2593676 RepID=UPI0008DE116F|nr:MULTISPECIES: methylated-DNA--[protein]-cysteine S-methyltransferase [unclassified Streptomyces]OII61792.1 cysteine methyltransferase [Streptomyces sp. CC53]
MTVYTQVGSPLGDILLVGDEQPDGSAALRSVSLPGQKGGAVVRDAGRRAPAAFTPVVEQLDAYFAGSRTRFDVPWVMPATATAFQQRVWRVLDDIPYGTTVTYGEVAARVGIGGAGVRAVGTAIGRNPLLVVRPCHRVIGADGALRGYAAGAERKQLLLGWEGARVR